MGIEILSVPRGTRQITSAGPLTLPVGFDHKKHAAKWVRVGPMVAAAAEREHLVGTENVTADGWQVWKDGENAVAGKPYKVALASGEHVLLFRDKAVQEAVNAIYGNIGKERMSQERRGETTGGIPTSDSGMLNDDRLSRVIGKEPLEEGDVKLNKVPNVRRVEPCEILVRE